MAKINKEKVFCSNCGRHFNYLTDLYNIRSLGLALLGNCSKCGNLVGCNFLWKRTKVIENIAEEKII